MRFEAKVERCSLTLETYVGKVIDHQTEQVVYETEPTTHAEAARMATTRAYTPSTEHCLRF